jgi:hypothetical protein
VPRSVISAIALIRAAFGVDQDPLWPAFEAFMIARMGWQKGWNWCDNHLCTGRGWWALWLSFKASAAAALAVGAVVGTGARDGG